MSPNPTPFHDEGAEHLADLRLSLWLQNPAVTLAPPNFLRCH